MRGGEAGRISKAGVPPGNPQVGDSYLQRWRQSLRLLRSVFLTGTVISGINAGFPKA